MLNALARGKKVKNEGKRSEREKQSQLKQNKFPPNVPPIFLRLLQYLF